MILFDKSRQYHFYSFSIIPTLLIFGVNFRGINSTFREVIFKSASDLKTEIQETINHSSEFQSSGRVPENYFELVSFFSSDENFLKNKEFIPYEILKMDFHSRDP